MTKKTGVKNRRLLFAKNLIMMLVMLVVIFLAVFAWYYENGQVTATGTTAKATNPDVVQIAVEKNGAIGNYVENTSTHEMEWKAGKWVDSVNFDTRNFEFSTDVTSNGLDFLIPGFISTEDNETAKDEALKNGKIVNINIPPTNAKSNMDLTSEEVDAGKKPDYYSARFYLRSKNPSIYVMPSAYLAMKAESDGVAITSSNSVRKSAYGDFTSDVLVGAMRVSLTGGAVSSVSNAYAPTRADANDEATFVWVPRPDLFLNIPYGTNDTDWTLVQNVTASDSIYRLRDASHPSDHPGENLTGATYQHQYYARKTGGVELKTAVTTGSEPEAVISNPNNSYTLPGTGNSVPTLGQSCDITGFTTTANAISMKVDPYAATESEKTDDYYVYQFRINIWIEGTDTEARRAMDLGQFNLYMEFGDS